MVLLKRLLFLSLRGIAHIFAKYEASGAYRDDNYKKRVDYI